MAKTRGSLRRAGAAALLSAALLATPLAAAAHEYDPDTAGNPVRIAAYILHPVGVALDYGIARPFHWLVTREPFRTLFGHTEGD